MKKHVFGRGIGKFLRINFVIAFAVSLFFIDEVHFTIAWFGEYLLKNFLFSFLISVFMSGGIGTLIQFSSRHISWLESPVKRLVVDVVGIVVYAFLVSLFLNVLYIVYVWKVAPLDQLTFQNLFWPVAIPVGIALLITLVLTSRAFLFEWKQAVVEAEKMKTERLAGQYQSLKDQLNPHFLFNSLNTLSSLIYEDRDQANDFVERLAKIYRYVLDVQDERLVALDRELAFSKSYLELQKLRFGEKLEYEVDAFSGNGKQLPPLSLQLLLENAVKHNSATREKPLHIRIFEENDHIVVENNVQPRKQSGPESGIGLENIRRRLSYLTDKPMDVISGNGTFKVSIPLIHSDL